MSVICIPVSPVDGRAPTARRDARVLPPVKAMPAAVMGKDIPLKDIFDSEHKRFSEGGEFRGLYESDNDVKRVVDTARVEKLMHTLLERNQERLRELLQVQRSETALTFLLTQLIAPPLVTLRHAVAGGIDRAQAVLGHDVALFGRAAIPAHGFLRIRGDAQAGGMDHAPQRRPIESAHER